MLMSSCPIGGLNTSSMKVLTGPGTPPPPVLAVPVTFRTFPCSQRAGQHTLETSISCSLSSLRIHLSWTFRRLTVGTRPSLLHVAVETWGLCNTCWTTVQMSTWPIRWFDAAVWGCPGAPADSDSWLQKQRTALHYVSRRTFSLLDYLMMAILMPILLIGYFIMVHHTDVDVAWEEMRSDVTVSVEPSGAAGGFWQ